MSVNTKCEEIRDLFSPWLDGEISAGEGDLLTGHLLTCEPCRKEFELWQKIAETLRNDIVDGEPSRDFCAGVMSRLQIETEAAQKPGRGLFHTWRAPAAAAAAAVMLFAGSWGVNVALKPGKPPVVIVDNKGQTGDNTTKGQENVAPPEKATQPDDAGKTVSPGTPAGETGSGNNEVKSGPAPAESPKSGEPLKNAVLLSNSYRDVDSTILKLSVANTEDAKNVALNMAAGKGGGGQVLATQKKGAGDLVILRMTVPREDGKSLVAQLSGLGGVISRDDERKNISDNYNQAVNRRNELLAGMTPDMAAGDKSRLEAEASVLKRQIESWDKEASSYVIILWLEH